MALADRGHHLVRLGDHLQSVVVADGDTFGTALALAGVNDDVEHTAGKALFLGAFIVFLGFGPLPAEHFSVNLGNGLELGFQLGFGQDLAKDGGVRTFGDAVHAAGAVFGDVFGNLVSNIAEIAQGGGARWNQGSGHRQVGRQVLFAIAFLVAADDTLVEIHHVQDRQVNQLVAAIDNRAIGVVIERILGIGFVHGRQGLAVRGYHRNMLLDRRMVNGQTPEVIKILLMAWPPAVFHWPVAVRLP